MTRHRTIAETICAEARRWSVRLERRSGNIAVIPAGRAPAEYLQLIRANKSAVISWLEAIEAGLQRDQAGWMHTAKQVLLSEWDGGDSVRTKRS